jgi:hypothetical protein
LDNENFSEGSLQVESFVRPGKLYFGGDLPLIVLSDLVWEHVRPWANQQEAAKAAAADEHTLNEILLD